MSGALSRIERLKTQLTNYKAELKAGAKIGTMALLTSSGGVLAGWCYAKYPTISNTTFPTAGALGSGLMLASLANLFDDYSDTAAAVGSGLLAVVLSKEAEKYFHE
jgi:1,4-dihydroxy-2-naphthoate octaprenyltransferase